MSNILAHPLNEVKPGQSVELFPESYIDDAFADSRAKLADLKRQIAADLDTADDEWSDKYIDQLEADHAADAALDFATEFGFWSC